MTLYRNNAVGNCFRAETANVEVERLVPLSPRLRWAGPKTLGEFSGNQHIEDYRSHRPTASHVFTLQLLRDSLVVTGLACPEHARGALVENVEWAEAGPGSATRATTQTTGRVMWGGDSAPRHRMNNDDQGEERNPRPASYSTIWNGR